MAAIAAGIAAGVPLERAIQTIESFDPVPGRMSPHETADGITFIRDDWKSPMWTMPASFNFMRTADASRKILVIGSISDTPKSFYKRSRFVIKQTLDFADKIIFVGQHAYSALRARTNPEDQRIMAFGTVYQLNSFLNNYIKTGDLVLLKGSAKTDHLQRIILWRTNDIVCPREKCDKMRFCSDCRLLRSLPDAADESHIRQ